MNKLQHIYISEYNTTMKQINYNYMYARIWLNHKNMKLKKKASHRKLQSVRFDLYKG